MTFCLFVIAAAVQADSFGRFGYSANPGLPSITVDKTGFVTTYPGASRIDFASPATKFAAQSTSATEQICAVEGGDGCPKKIRTSLVGNSVDFFFPAGLSLICRSVEGPFLNWADSSIGAGFSTKDVKWVLISFSTAEPPYLCGFCGKTASLALGGKKGAWTITSQDFNGWLRVWLPFGLDPQYATDVHGLSNMSSEAIPLAEVWESDAPAVTNLDVKASEHGVDATWTFSGPGAFIPQAAMMATYGGSTLEIKTPIQSAPGSGLDGLRAISKGNLLTIHFPCRRIGPGRALGLVGENREPMVSASITDPPSLVELGNEILVASADDALLKLGDDTVTRFLTESAYVQEPNTRQQLPYSADGPGVVVASSQAYLAQCGMVAVGSTQPNALFDSILWKRDWWSWTIWTSDEETSRRATALGALAGAMSNDPIERLYGATLEAGLDGQRGAWIWRARAKLVKDEKEPIDPLLGLRTGFFALTRQKETNLDFFRLLSSPLKVGIGPALTMKKDAADLVLEWKCDEVKPSTLSFFSAPPNCKASVVDNISKLDAVRDKNDLKLLYTPVTLGSCSVKLALANPSLVIPKEVNAPTF